MTSDERDAHDAEARELADSVWGDAVPEEVWANVVDAFDLFSMRPALRSTLRALLHMARPNGPEVLT